MVGRLYALHHLFAIQLLFKLDSTLLSFCFKHQLLPINLAAVRAGRFSNATTKRQALNVTGNFKMTQPTFPIICIDNGLEIIVSDKSFSKVSTLALLNPDFFDNVILFDVQHNQWTYKQTADKFKNTFLTRLLSKVFYNPIFDAKVIWTFRGNYELDYLKSKIIKCIDKDDDVLTQFTEPEVIKSSIESSSSFQELIKLLNKYVFEYRE